MNRITAMTCALLVVCMAAFIGISYGSCGAAQESSTIMVPANFSNLAEKAKPGVVNIRTVKTVKDGGRVFRHFYGNPYGDERNPFEDFFGPFTAGHMVDIRISIGYKIYLPL